MTAKQIKQPPAGRKSWRDVLKVHPAAAAYPRLSDDELAELGADIKARGLQVNVVLFREGGNSNKDQLLDGISRLDAQKPASAPPVDKDADHKS